MQRLTLVIAFRETGWRRPLRDPVALEVWGPDAQLLAVLPASYLEELVRTHLALSELQARFAAYVAPATHPTPPRADPPTTLQPRLRRTNGRRLRQQPGSFPA